MFNVILKCSKEQKKEFNNEEEIVDVEMDQSEEEISDELESEEETLSGGFTDEYYRLMEEKRRVTIDIE